MPFAGGRRSVVSLKRRIARNVSREPTCEQPDQQHPQGCATVAAAHKLNVPCTLSIAHETTPPHDRRTPCFD
jgi:hypothetical protein